MNSMIILAGPTAAGKTALSLDLAEAINGSIISADSMQVYRGMDIGSAKIPESDRRGIPHYLIDVLDPKEPFHAERFQALAREAAADIWNNDRIPVVTGGTGFYIQALLYDIDFTDTVPDDAYRRQLYGMAAAEGNAKLHDRLAEIDLESASAIHPNNVRKVVRALEFYKETGTRFSDHNRAQRMRSSPYDFRYFVLFEPLDSLYRRIDDRVDEMIDEGLPEEVRALRDSGCTRDMTSMQGLGYKELFMWLDGVCSFEEAVRLIKRDTRHYAKRQMTWFRRERDIIWIDKSKYGYNEETILNLLIEKSKGLIS